MNTPRLKISERMRAMMGYDKLAGPAPRMLVLRSRYWLDDAAIHAARQMGWEVETVPVVQEGLLPRDAVERLLTTLGLFKPDFILSVNLAGMDLDGLFAGLFEDLEVPYVTWFVDDPRPIIMERASFGSRYAIALTWDAAYAPYLRRHGFSHVHTLPLAADITLFNAEPTGQIPLPDTGELPPTFVGNSMIRFAESKWAELERHPDLAQAVREAFNAGRVTRANFGVGLEAMLGQDALNQTDAEQLRLAEMVCFIEGTRRSRNAFMCGLVPEGLQIRGDADWKRAFPTAGDHVNYTKELPGFYRRCALNFNVTSIQMPNTVNQRVFDCPAAGGFLLTDAQPALRELFDVEREVACYSGIEECLDLFRFYRAHANARVEIATRARKRILGEHTYAHRLRTIAALVGQHLAG